MLLTSSSNLLDSEAAEDLITKELYPIETYAEGLMNEIFADIDNILNDHNSDHCDQTEEKYVHNLNTALTRTDGSLSPKVKHSLTSASLVKSSLKTDLVVNSSFPGAITTKERSQTSGLDKLIYMGFGWSVATLCTLCITNLALLNTNNTQLNSSSQNTHTLSSVDVKSDPQLDLVNYMLTAFSLIDQQEKSNYTAIVKPEFTNITFKQKKASPGQSTLSQIKASPLPVAINNLPPVPQVAMDTNATNRKNIPVDQSPALRYEQPTASPVIIPQPSSSVVNNPPIKNAQPATQPKTKKTEVNSQPLKDAPPKVATITPTVSVQLEGILESGDQSVALFNIDGTTRGVNLGENIGGTGWILIEISNGEAIIRRHGEKRSIYAGQRL